MKIPSRQELDASLQSVTKCCDIYKYHEGKYLFIIPVSKFIDWHVHYELCNQKIHLHIETDNAILLKQHLNEQLLSDTHFKWDSWQNRNFSDFILNRKIDVTNLQDITKGFKELFDVVDPCVKEYENKQLQWLDFVNALAEIRQREKDKLPYRMNLLDEIHANENAHTRILLQMLRYKQGKEYPILRSFLELVQKKCNVEIQANYDQPFKIFFNKENIDGLIVFQKSAVIIENKIHWAIDQDQQIERYIQIVNGHKIPEKNIFVIYLTSDGNKIVESYSFTETAKKMLDWQDVENPGRFIEMNYKNDILQWLKVLPQIDKKEDLFFSAIKQYIDHLEGQYAERESEKQYYMKFTTELFKRLKINSKDVLSKQWDTLKNATLQINDIQALVSNAMSQIEDATSKEFEELAAENGFKNNLKNEIQNGYFQLFCGGECPSLVHLEWFPLGCNELFNATCLALCLHTEGTYKKLKEELFPDINDQSYKLSASFANMSTKERKETFQEFYREIKPIANKIKIRMEKHLKRTFPVEESKQTPV